VRAVAAAAPPHPTTSLVRVIRAVGAAAPPNSAAMPAHVVRAAALPHPTTSLARVIGAVGAASPHYRAAARRSRSSLWSPGPTMPHDRRVSLVPLGRPHRPIPPPRRRAPARRQRHPTPQPHWRASSVPSMRPRRPIVPQRGARFCRGGRLAPLRHHTGARRRCRRGGYAAPPCQLPRIFGFVRQARALALLGSSVFAALPGSPGDLDICGRPERWQMLRFGR